MSGSLIVERPDPRIARLVLCQPGKKNAIDDALRDALAGALADALANDGVDAIILTGAGANFSAGGDIDGLSRLDLKNFREWLGKSHDIVRAISGSEKPVIASVKGVCAGGGLSLAMAADVVLAGESARFSCGFGGIGLIPDLGLLHTLRERVGTGAAKRLINGKKPIGAGAALAIGLVDEAVPDEELEAASCAEALRLASFSKLAFRLTKALLSAPATRLDALLDAELDAQERCIHSPEFTKRAAAFLGRRQTAPQKS
jgi:2-(1,2-epoxy-1,2-dihydrophenyl)acetyl-CoA isomerase